MHKTVASYRIVQGVITGLTVNYGISNTYVIVTMVYS